MTNKPPVRVEFTPYFLRILKRLRKKYPNIAVDLKQLTDQLEKGETPGDQIPGTGYTAYKVRVRNRDAQSGKSGGYRVIYYIETPERVIVLLMYPKSERTDISAEQIKRIIEEYKPTEE